MSAGLLTKGEITRSLATPFRRKDNRPNAIVDLMKDGFSVKIVVAMTEPTATVTAKSKLESFKKDLRPARRASRYSIRYTHRQFTSASSAGEHCIRNSSAY